MSDVRDFLKHFPGNHIFASKSDKEARPPWHFALPYDEAEPKLREREEFGWGTFFTVNELDQSKDPGLPDKPKHRTKKMFKRARAVFLDFDKDDKQPPDSFPLQPNIIVTSSPGKYHFYWLTETEDSAEWNAVMEGIVIKYDGDPQAKDLARVLRLPTYNHNKYEPFYVDFTVYRDEPYAWDEIVANFPPVRKKTAGVDLSKLSEQNAEITEQLKSDQPFSTTTAINQILTAESYHGPLTSLAMRYVNKNMDRQEIYHVLRGLGEIANKREEWEDRFSDSHLYECIDSAIAKKAEEDLMNMAAVPDAVESKELPVPDFPRDVVLGWPEPWPMLWSNYIKLPRTPDPCLLLPTVLTMQSFWLSSRYVNEWNKRPNLAFLAVAPSTGNKDVNSKDVIESVREILIRKNKNWMFFHKILSYPESITADTSFIQSFDENGDLFWINTEATYIFQQLANSRNNAAMKNLEAKMIEVVDGGPIHGKRKAGESVKTIEDPNAQILLYAQPETIRAYLQDSIIDSGLLGRFMLHVPAIDTTNPFQHAFIRRTEDHKDLTDDFTKYFNSQQPKKSEKIELRPDDENLARLQRWMMEDISKLAKGDQHIKLLRRLAVSAEQLYTLILGTMRHWDFINDVEPRKSFDVECMLPLLNYWAKCKVYALNEYIDESVDPLADHIYEIAAKLIRGEIKSSKYAHVIKKYNAVPRTEIDRVIQSRRGLIQMLDARKDMRNVRVRTNQLIDMWVKHGTMIEIEHGRKRLVGFTKDHEDDL